jgi:hypothetical protein
MQITYSPGALPGSCYFCGNGSREYYVDTGLSVEFHGAMYICNICATDIAHLIKFISPDEFKSIRQGKEELESINYELIKRVGVLEESLRELANAGYGTNSGGDVIRYGGALLETSEQSDKTISIGADELGEGEGASSESSDDENLGELRSDDKRDEFTFDFG